MLQNWPLAALSTWIVSSVKPIMSGYLSSMTWAKKCSMLILPSCVLVFSSWVQTNMPILFLKIFLMWKLFKWQKKSIINQEVCKRERVISKSTVFPVCGRFPCITLKCRTGLGGWKNHKTSEFHPWLIHAHLALCTCESVCMCEWERENVDLSQYKYVYQMTHLHWKKCCLFCLHIASNKYVITVNSNFCIWFAGCDTKKVHAE